MAREQDIIQKLTHMRVGQIVTFSTKEPNQNLEVERIIIGINPGWVIYYTEGRKVIRELDEAVQFISERWNFDLKSFLKKQMIAVDEIEDLGEF
ncbi:hypothetical protein [Thermoflavimicrobium daqui]|uniref:Uncharacterized protein n=1 Tax=Thermoflavimicrobium daqui TaxID=2137476 RepID=A0A364K648_9BACL|nr:hypothetical protein [Thermoflavimicrobium daqui]RAL25776.1 hypothetical protein DL897_06790 [Thermoflavimicrobium daqui]